MPKPTCIRCKAVLDPPLNQHALSKCGRAPPASIDQLWPDCEALGDACEAPEETNIAQCKVICETFKPDSEFQDKPLTKHMLEALFQKAYARPKKASVPVVKQNLPLRASTSSNTTTQGSPSAGAQSESTAAVSSPPPWRLKFQNRVGLVSPLPKKEVITCVDRGLNVCKALQPVDINRRGVSGKAIFVSTNYVVVDQLPKQLFVYTIAYGEIKTNDSNATIADTTKPPRRIKRLAEKKLVFEGLREETPLQGRNDWATDCDTLWSGTALHDATEPGFVMPHIGFKKATGRSATIDHVTFTYKEKLEFPAQDTTRSLLNSSQDGERGASSYIAALNGLVSKHVTEARHGIVQVGPNKFFLSDVYSHMPHPRWKPKSQGEDTWSPLNAHRGYYSSIRPGADRVLLNIGAKTTAFLHPMPVSDFLRCVNQGGYEQYGDAEGLLKNSMLRIAYDRQQFHDDFDPNEENNRRKAFASLGSMPPGQQTFDHPQKGTIDVARYFEEDLKATTVPNNIFPCVNAGVRPRMIDGAEDPETVGKQLWVPAEFLEVVPNQPLSQQLSPNDMDAMLKAAQHAPGTLQKLIAGEGFDALGLTGKDADHLKLLGLHIKPQLLQIPARCLPTPGITFSDRKAINVRNASWFLETSDGGPPVTFCHVPQQRARIHVLDLTLGGVGDLAGRLVDALNTRLTRHSFKFADGSAAQTFHLVTDSISFNPRAHEHKQPPRFGLQDLSDETLITKFGALAKSYNDADSFLVLLDNKQSAINSAEYARVKRVFDQHLGLHTVCLTVPKFTFKYPDTKEEYLDVPGGQLFSNLALKFNLKLGGQNHSVVAGKDRNAKSAFHDIQADTIVLGADVSHAPSKFPDCPSVAAVVGNIDREFATFPGSMRLQAKGQEVIAELRNMVAERVVAYSIATKKFPTRMIFFRDGIGEDQFDNASDVEMERVKDGYEDAFGTLKEAKVSGLTLTKPAKLDLVFIVVGKRHHTRFFPVDDANADKKGNVLPGLIVDSVITRPDVTKVYDFFLQSHAALNGTAKSAHYIVLEPGSMKADQIQALTYAFCYNYARASKGVSYAGPAYYADRLCERGTHYLKGYTIMNMNQGHGRVITDDEKKGGKDGMNAFRNRVAGHISRQTTWNPYCEDVPSRKNPWHPRLDNVMFWL
ncbi:hypothetical protein LTR56_001269 [Elasticomyces elasticus]|nr:hypothetical protein LTR56_001269 [Elasticomyces elasticus]KAK3667450.1 hypothetical protein LTR22_001628 [Elasticomyces elasticus]KAK4907536.1 hypothetical protein LTR49_023477 [Elasticomyces elasticus]KAK5760481.1 hypothetical protein LTS12_009354 [Elasticomyces elasticus]